MVVRILFFTENAADSALTRNYLSGQPDFTLIEVNSSSSFLEELSRKDEYHVILCDLDCHTLDSAFILEKIRLRAPGKPVVVISSTDSAEAALCALRHGASDYLLKDKESLNRLIPALLVAHKKSQEKSPAKHLDLQGLIMAYDSMEELYQDRAMRLEEMNTELEAEIDERRSTEKALYQSRQVLQSILDNIPQRIFWKNRDFVFQGCNRCFAKDAGFDSPEDIVGKDDFDMVWSKTAGLYRIDDTFVMENDCPKINYEEPQITKEGEFRWLRTNKIPLHNEDGQVIGILGTYEDITAQKDVEKLQDAIYRVSEAAYTASDLQVLFSQVHEIVGGLMDAPNLYIATYDANKKVVRFPYYIDQFDQENPDKDFSLAELGKSLTTYTLARGTPVLLDSISLEALQISGEIEPIGTLPNTWMGVPLLTTEKRPIGVIVVQSYNPNITYSEKELNIFSFVSSQIAMAIERKQTEENLRENEARLRWVNTHMSDVVSHVDASKNHIFVSPSAEHVLGYAPEFLLGRNAYEFFHPDDRLKSLQATWEAIEKGESQTQIEYRYRHANGNYIWIESVINILSDERGNFNGAIIGSRDVTARKEMEEALDLSEQRFRKYFDLPLIGMAIISAEGKWISVNDKLCSILQYDRDELLQCSWFEITPAEELAVDKHHYKAIYDGLTDGNTFQKRYIRKDGVWIDVEVSIFCVRKHKLEIDYFVAIIQDISERKQSERLIQNQLQRINALRTIDIAISSSNDLNSTLHIILRQVIQLLEVDAADVLLYDAEYESLRYAASTGFKTGMLRYTHLKLGEGFAGQAAVERRLIHIQDLSQSPDSFRRSPLLSEESFVSYFGIPLIAKEQVKGVLEIFHRSPLAPDPEWFSFLEALAGQASIAIDEIELFEGLQNTNRALKKAYETTLEGWARALELRDGETEGHSQRVTDLTYRMAQYMGIFGEELEHIRRGALLHDIGKMGVPDHILLSPETLSQEQWMIMRQHTDFAFQLLYPIEFLRPAIPIPYYHHEKWDGSGYPEGLKGEEIPLPARIFSIIDVYDALCFDRTYRPAWPKERVLEYIQSQSEKSFDPRIVTIFLEFLAREEFHKLAAQKNAPEDI